MKTYLITGATGFIGANFLKYILKKYEDIDVIVVDSLTVISQIELIKSLDYDLIELREFLKIENLKVFSLK